MPDDFCKKLPKFGKIMFGTAKVLKILTLFVLVEAGSDQRHTPQACEAFQPDRPSSVGPEAAAARVRTGPL
jgi:hypothetical protein